MAAPPGALIPGLVMPGIAALGPVAAAAALGPGAGLGVPAGLGAGLSISQIIYLIDTASKDEKAYQNAAAAAGPAGVAGPAGAAAEQATAQASLALVPASARAVVPTGFVLPSTITPHILYETVMLTSTSFKKYLNINKQSTFLVKDYDSLGQFFTENTNFTQAATQDDVYRVLEREHLTYADLSRILHININGIPAVAPPPAFLTGVNNFLDDLITDIGAGQRVIADPLVFDKGIGPSTKDYYEFYEPVNTGCGRQSLNNLLGAEIYDKDTIGAAYNIQEFYNMVHTNTKLKLMQFGTQLHTTINPAGPYAAVAGDLNAFCPDNEEYDPAILTLALFVLGFEVQKISAASIPRLIALGGDEIARTKGILLHSNGRWTILRKYVENRQTKFRYIDPMASETPEELQLPNGNIVKLGDPNVVNLKPAPRPAAAAAAAAPGRGPPGAVAAPGVVRNSEDAKRRLRGANGGSPWPAGTAAQPRPAGWNQNQIDQIMGLADRANPAVKNAVPFNQANYDAAMIAWLNTPANMPAGFPATAPGVFHN